MGDGADRKVGDASAPDMSFSHVVRFVASDFELLRQQRHAQVYAGGACGVVGVVVLVNMERQTTGQQRRARRGAALRRHPSGVEFGGRVGRGERLLLEHVVTVQDQAAPREAVQRRRMHLLVAVVADVKPAVVICRASIIFEYV